MEDERERKIAEIMKKVAQMDDEETRMLAEFLAAVLSSGVTSTCKCDSAS